MTTIIYFVQSPNKDVSFVPTSQMADIIQAYESRMGFRIIESYHEQELKQKIGVKANKHFISLLRK